jgi:hypothetical protein
VLPANRDQVTAMFSPTPIPEPANPLLRPLPQPPPDPVPADGEALWLTTLFLGLKRLRLVEHAFWIMASHGISASRPFPLVCAACQKPWRCPEITWAADWILSAQRLGLLNEVGLELSGDVLDILASWGSDLAARAGAGRIDG